MHEKQKQMDLDPFRTRNNDNKTKQQQQQRNTFSSCFCRECFLCMTPTPAFVSCTISVRLQHPGKASCVFTSNDSPSPQVSFHNLSQKLPDWKRRASLSSETIRAKGFAEEKKNRPRKTTLEQQFKRETTYLPRCTVFFF